MNRIIFLLVDADRGFAEHPEGMPCRFTVDAFPDRGFVGTVSQVRIAPDRLLNVVTYRVIITTANEDLALLPGMTANVEIVLGARDDVLRVPNAALRYEPREGRQDAGAAVAERGAAPAGARVWVLQEGKPVPRPVRTGLAGDLMTEILDGLAEGDEVIVGANRPEPR